MRGRDRRRRRTARARAARAGRLAAAGVGPSASAWSSSAPAWRAWPPPGTWPARGVSDLRACSSSRTRRAAPRGQAASAVDRLPVGRALPSAARPRGARGARLLRELGVIEGFDRAGRPIYDERHLCRAPQERVFHHGRWYEGLFPRDRRQRRGPAPSSRPSGARWTRCGAGATPRAAAPSPCRARPARPAPIRELDGVSMADWLAARGLTSPRLRWCVDYACRDDYGTDLAGHLRVGRHPLLRRARSRSRAYGDVVLTWPEGNGWLTQRLAEPRRRTGSVSASVVVNVEPAGGRRRGRRLRAAGRARPRDCWRARSSSRCPRLRRRAACTGPGASGRPRSRARSATRPGWSPTCTSTGPAGRGAGSPPAWDNVLYDSASLGYVVATHQSLRTHARPDGAHLLPPVRRRRPGRRPARAAGTSVGTLRRRASWRDLGRAASRTSRARSGGST